MFRRLCQYYIQCLLQDESPSLRAYLNRRNDTWIWLSQSIPWARLAGADGITVSLSGDEAGLQANRGRRGRDSTLFIGYPCEMVKPRASDPFVIPLFVLPLKADWQPTRIVLQPDGPITANGAWLEGRFRSRDEQQAFCEIVGLMPPEDGDLPDGTVFEVPDFEVLATRAAAYLTKDCREAIEPYQMSQSIRSEPNLSPGIYNRAILMAGSRITYTRSLIKDMTRIGEESTDEELDRTALAYLFPHDPPSPRPTSVPENAHGQPEEDTADFLSSPVKGLVQLRMLNSAQRESVRRAMSEPVSVVTGPPGTGKSEVVRAILVNALLQGKSALFASRNHRALDAVEPELNRLVEEGRLVIRASSQDLALRGSWAVLLRELLARPLPPDSGRLRERSDLLARLVDRQGELLKDLEQWQQVSIGYEDLATRLRAVQRELPLHLRDESVLAQWPGDSEETVALWFREYQRLAKPEPHWWMRLWRWLTRHKISLQKKQLAQTAKRWACPFHDKPLPALFGSEDPGVWSQAVTAWRRMAEGQVLLKQITEYERRIQSMPERENLTAELSSAHSQSAEVARNVLELIAGGHCGTLSREEREELANLRSGMANFGPTRWQREFRRNFSRLLRFFPLWAVTNLSVRSAIPLVPGVFELAVVDEASQCDIPSVIPLLFRARRAVVVGDPQQLTHITRLSSMRERQLLQTHGITDLSQQRFSYRENSYFSFASSSASIGQPVFLAEHYRCHPEIAEYASAAFYQHGLRVLTDVDRLRLPHKTRPGCHWTHIEGRIEAAATGAFSSNEVQAVVVELQKLVESRFDGTVGVVTPFKHQKIRLEDAIRREVPPDFLSKVRYLSDTAHGFQGDERDVMFLSLSCGPEMPAGALRFVADNPNLFNVAVTRARAVLHVVGNRVWALECGVSYIEKLARLCGQPAMENVPSPEPYESPWEQTFDEALRQQGIRTVPQYSIAGRRLDLAVILSHSRLDIEVDGEAYHRTGHGERKDDDVWRDLQLRALGWDVRRFWVYELRENMDACVEQVRKWMKEHGD